ncbi:hypothetical protein [Sorangium sp. So ce1000]|uniref:hypothetical protein n=1 Tax=Sorangium sp. So ce1000 TaxID=3133325 RepID=UPI003F5FAA30
MRSRALLPTQRPFYGLWDLAENSAIFIAPDGLNAGCGNTNGEALGCARPDVLRAIAVYSGADFLVGCDGGTMPVAFYGSRGVCDGTCAYTSGEQIRGRFVKNNGCTSQDRPEPAKGSGMHSCVSYTGCSSGHPTRWRAFDGDHNPSPKGQRPADDLKSSRGLGLHHAVLS